MVLADIDEKEVQNFSMLLDLLKRLIEDGVTPLIENQVKSLLDQCLQFHANLIIEDSFPEIHRLTINNRVLGENKRIKEIKFLKYPPSELVKSYGRCNKPGESILYATFHGITALNELKPKVGDLITKTIWRVREEQTLKFCPIFRNQPAGGKVINPRLLEINRDFEKSIKDFPKNIKSQIILLTQFVADAFSKDINSKNDLDYIFSAYFASKIFNEFENKSIEAIYYPSVQDKLSFENLAIKPTVFDAKYELVEVKESIILNDLSNGHGGYYMAGISNCKKFDFVSDIILWEKDKFYQSKEELERFSREFNLIID